VGLNQKNGQRESRRTNNEGVIREVKGDRVLTQNVRTKELGGRQEARIKPSLRWKKPAIKSRGGMFFKQDND